MISVVIGDFAQGCLEWDHDPWCLRETREFKEWCAGVSLDHWHWEADPDTWGQAIFRFRDPRDATLFKITWGGR